MISLCRGECVSALFPFSFQGKPLAELAAELLALGCGLVILFDISLHTALLSGQLL